MNQRERYKYEEPIFPVGENGVIFKVKDVAGEEHLVYGDSFAEMVIMELIKRAQAGDKKND